MNKLAEKPCAAEGERQAQPTELDERRQVVAEYVQNLRAIITRLRGRLN